MLKYLALMILENPRGQNCDRKCKKKEREFKNRSKLFSNDRGWVLTLPKYIFPEKFIKIN